VLERARERRKSEPGKAGGWQAGSGEGDGDEW
jgi:hypothetical protein